MTDLSWDVFLPVSAQPSYETHVAFAQRAEEQGYERAWMAETWGRDSITTLAAVAERTDRIGIGTSITSVYSRSPGLISQTACTLQELSSGRFRLGLGPSTPPLVERWHGGKYERPLRRLRETIEIVREAVSGEVVNYDGSVFDLSGFRLRFDPPDPPPAIDVAALGPKAVELAGRFADGCHTVTATPDGLRERLEQLRQGAEFGGRDPDDVRVMLEIPCCVLEDQERARWLARHHTAFYIGGMGQYYRDSLARQGYPETANEVATHWADDNTADAMAAISDDLLDEMAIAGAPAQVGELLEQWEAVDGLDAIAVVFPVAAEPEEIKTTIDSLAP